MCCVGATLGAVAVDAEALGQATFPGLVHRWSANGSLVDSVGGANGVANGAVGFVPGVFGQAFDLDPGEFVSAGTGAANLGASDFTIAFWVRFDAPISAPMISKRALCSLVEMIDIRATLTSQVVIELAGENAANYTLAFADGPVNDGSWHHVAWRRSGQIADGFIDGCFAGSNFGAGVVDFFTEAASLEFGRDVCVGSAGTLPMDGAMDEIQIYARALDGDEISALALRGSSDIDTSGQVNAADLAILLGAWGPCAGCCQADLNGDRVVNASDIGVLLGDWTG
jgi:hypothetical protein